MTGKHYNWHKAWSLDTEACSAAHTSGLQVHYLPAAAWPVGQSPPEIGGAGTSRDGREWLAFRVGSEAELGEWIRGQQAVGVRTADQISQRMARLMREAVDLWLHHVNKS